ncbi:hypothetical protein [Sulfitobacter sp. S190]|uniref:hypothetical protein n=1 Tax=Sulfitobacter sp. S190 TaxID=2867022 RepID=UPI0021A884F1|nr:hypothetical protein [Sulfitobacter sp. S190]UWR23879.1 hypothetical protein K3756_07980 [Sulfitobacter sp. S190]
MSSNQTIAKRRVFYIPGYDPIHPRRYRELYRSEGAAQAAISGYEIALKGQAGRKTYGWDVTATIDGQTVSSRFDVLVWSDIVRDSMATSILATYTQLFKTAYIYMSTGALWRLMRLRKGPVITALYPVVMLLGQLALAIALAVLLGLAGGALLGPAMGVVGDVIGYTIGIGAAYALMRWFKKKDGRFFAYYLMHDYAYGASTRGAYANPLERRLAAFKVAVADALNSDVDEVLVVGHSSGAHLGVSVLADLLREDGPPATGPQLAFLTLGQVVPMLSFLPDANRLRGDLRYLSGHEAVCWIDVSAPGDGCAFALCDPVAVTGVAPPDQRWPLVFSAAFTKSLSAERWKELRWRFFRLHFQYLCAFDRPRDYDYFQITAGPLALATRYKDRGPSKSRITSPINRYTGTSS